MTAESWVTLDLCGGYTTRLSGGSQVDVVCGSVRLRVRQGQAEVVLAGGVTLVQFPAGSEGRVEAIADVTTVYNTGTLPLSISVDGVTRSLSGGASTPTRAWRFVGFTQPVDALPTLNQVTAGQAVPLRWRVVDSEGAPVTTLASATVSIAPLACELRRSVDALEETVPNSSGLKNLGNGYYQLNWNSLATYADSCRRLRLDIGDGVTHDADFRFAR